MKIFVDSVADMRRKSTKTLTKHASLLLASSLLTKLTKYPKLSSHLSACPSQVFLAYFLENMPATVKIARRNTRWKGLPQGISAFIVPHHPLKKVTGRTRKLPRPTKTCVT